MHKLDIIKHRKIKKGDFIMKKFKKVLCVLMAVMTLSMVLAGCGKKNEGSKGASSSGEFKKIKIGYATNTVDETFVAMKKSYETVVGPALNIEFMFSEALTDAGALTTFIENAYASGCDGIITDLSTSIDQAAATCNNLGIWFVGISSAPAKENTEMEKYLSVAGASSEGFSSSYGEAIKSVVGDGKKHSILLMSGAASYGATSFIEGTAGTLKALQDVYGLKYTNDIAKLATTKTQIDAENDKGIKITIFPGMADLATAVSPLLQTGKYDVLVGTSNIYDSLGVAVDEVEKSLKMDIKFISRSVISAAITAAVNSKDSQGSPVIDALVSPASFERIEAALVIRNAYDGYADKMRADGKCSTINKNAPLTITTVQQYNVLAKDTIPFAFVTADEILSLTNKKNPDVTWKTINDYGANLTTQKIVEKFK
jgi:hypothetical protein